MSCEVNCMQEKILTSLIEKMGDVVTAYYFMPLTVTTGVVQYDLNIGVGGDVYYRMLRDRSIEFSEVPSCIRDLFI